MRPFLALALAWGVIAAAVNVTIPSLVQCEPATFQVEAKGNYTIEARDAARMSLVLRVHLPAGTTNFTWPAVEVASSGTLIVIVTDSYGPRRTDVAQTINYGVVGTSPTNDDRCLRKSKPRDRHSRGIEIPIVAGVLGGILILLICLILLVMLRRKRERRNAAPSEDQAQFFGPAGGGYMSKLVPGLQLDVTAAPPPRRQHQRRRRRRGLKTWRAEEEADLPSYGDSQKVPPGYMFESFELPERYAAMGSTTHLTQDEEDRIRPAPDTNNRI